MSNDKQRLAVLYGSNSNSTFVRRMHGHRRMGKHPRPYSDNEKGSAAVRQRAVNKLQSTAAFCELKGVGEIISSLSGGKTLNGPEIALVLSRAGFSRLTEEEATAICFHEGITSSQPLLHAIHKAARDGRKLELGRRKCEMERRQECTRRQEKNKELMRKRISLAQCDFAFEESHLNSALVKIRVAAKAYNKERSGGLKTFNQSKMDPVMFRDLLKNRLGVHLSPKELGGAFQLFNRDSCGQVDAKEFLIAFMQLYVGKKDNKPTTVNAEAVISPLTTPPPGSRFAAHAGSRVDVPTRRSKIYHYLDEMRKESLSQRVLVEDTMTAGKTEGGGKTIKGPSDNLKVVKSSEHQFHLGAASRASSLSPPGWQGLEASLPSISSSMRDLSSRKITESSSKRVSKGVTK